MKQLAFLSQLSPLTLSLLSLLATSSLSGEVRREQLHSATLAGVHFLIQSQNKDGSWGGVRNTKGLSVYAPIPGAHHAFKLASTSLALSGMLAHAEVCSQLPGAPHSLEAAEHWLLTEHKKVKRATGDTIYNIWAHTYALQVFSLLAQRSTATPALVTRYREAAQHHYQRLLHYELLGGGWSYYNFGRDQGGLITKVPTGAQNSFLTAAALIAIHYAASELHITTDAARTARSYKALLSQRLPDGSYLYGDYMKSRPRYGANRPAGSLARTPAALKALSLQQDIPVKPGELQRWVTRFIQRHGFLKNAKKRPIPHESPFLVSGYYYYYGQYYVSQLLEHLPEQEQSAYAQALAELLLKEQEKDGSWWDFPLYDYHKSYGTGYALLALAAYAPFTSTGGTE